MRNNIASYVGFYSMSVSNAEHADHGWVGRGRCLTRQPEREASLGFRVSYRKSKLPMVRADIGGRVQQKLHATQKLFPPA